jgi:TRAP-type C4-dicarboxylate transport system permease small subunit
MEWFDTLKSRIQRLNRLVSGVGAVFLIPLMLITTADVICRDLFNRPVAGAAELSGYFLAVFVLLGLGYTQQVKGHVGVSVITSRLSPRPRLILNIITTLIGLFIFSILIWQGLIAGIEERTVSDLLRIPQYPFRLLVAVAAFSVCLELLVDVGDSIRKIAGRPS